MPDKDIEDKLKEVVTSSDHKKFMEFARDIQDEKIEKCTILQLDGDFQDKEARTKLHQFIKKYLKKYEADTLSIGDKRSMRVYLKDSMGKNKRQKNGISTFGDRDQFGSIKLPEVLSFAVQKINYESMQAVHYISKRVNKRPKYFGMSGNKDKRGITTQRITLSRGNPEKLIQIQCGKDWDKKVKCGSFARVFHMLNLGQLYGNRFSVALRFIDNDLPSEKIL